MTSSTISNRYESTRKSRVIARVIWVVVTHLCASGVVRAEPRVPVPAQTIEAWQAFLRATEKPLFTVTAISRDPRTGDFWLATWGSGLVRYSGGRFDVFNQFNSGLAGDLVFDVCVHDGLVWAATIGGVSAYAHSTDDWKLHFPRQRSFGGPVYTRVKRVDGELRVATTDGLAAVFDAEDDRWNEGFLPALKFAAVGLTGFPASRGAPSRQAAIAVYGPRNRMIHLPGPEVLEDRLDLSTVECAVEMANDAAPDHEGKIDLLKASSGYDRYGWTLPEDDVVLFSLNPSIGGIVGHLAPTTDPVLYEVVARTGIPFVSTARLDRENRERLLATPNAFQCLGNLKRAHRMLANDLVDSNSGKRIAIVMSGSEPGDVRLRWWRDLAAKRGVTIIGWSPESKLALPVDLVVTWTDAESSVRIVEQVRGAGIHCPIVVSDDCLRDDLASLASVPLGELVTLNEEALGAAPFDEDFAVKFERTHARHRILPGRTSYDGQQTFDGVDHLLSAVRKANSKHHRVEEVLAEMRDSAYGEAHFDDKHTTTTVPIARFINESWLPREIRNAERRERVISHE